MKLHLLALSLLAVSTSAIHRYGRQASNSTTAATVGGSCLTKPEMRICRDLAHYVTFSTDTNHFCQKNYQADLPKVNEMCLHEDTKGLRSPLKAALEKIKKSDLYDSNYNTVCAKIFNEDGIKTISDCTWPEAGSEPKCGRAFDAGILQNHILTPRKGGSENCHTK
eukprot:CAMPEP_0197516218 /NCGR_PEP_ID=MMETSP1318-20131121/1059_1 /TAXON_ID=552666 /ORGANISM="Partenskyella glossopodia, Strain RCC365" /LENGTH=165 /DNA_ID=CAMNT_0043064757 /DNA_START=9 /DNA_END=506 /DNA_ORIENTATION=+